jgi:DNA ligase D-like protein (predicted polymerase)
MAPLLPYHDTVALPLERETVLVDGREVTISNPDKVLFPEKGHTKRDLVRYYLGVAPGALRAAGNRPNVLVRYPNGVGGEFFFQKRAPTARPPWLDAVALRFPSGRTAEEIVPREPAALAWMANLACLELHPHPVRADDLDHPDELRIDLDPVPGVAWSQLREVATHVRAVLGDLGLTGWPKTSGSRGIHVYVRIERRWGFTDLRRAALAFAREVERRAPTLATSKWWKEERHGVFLDYNQNAKDRTIAAAYSVRPTPDARVSAPLSWDELDAADPADFTLATMPARFKALGDSHAAMDERSFSLETLLDLSARHEREGLGDAPWPPHYQKQSGEPPRVQPSKRRRPRSVSEKPEHAPSKPASPANTQTISDDCARSAPTRSPIRHYSDGLLGRGAEGAGRAAEAGETREAGARKGDTPRRRRPSRPLVEIGRSPSREAVLAGLERWKTRHPEAATHLQAADVLIDAMRGRFTTWTRVRVNLQHVPDASRPEQEPLDPDDTPNDWANVRPDGTSRRTLSRARKAR